MLYLKHHVHWGKKEFLIILHEQECSFSNDGLFQIFGIMSILSLGWFQ